MMNFQSSGCTTSLAFIFSLFDCFFSKWFPSISIGLILPTIPFRMFFTMQSIFSPPFCRTRMATKKMFGMKVRCWTAKCFPTPIASFCKSVASPRIFSSYFSNLSTFTGAIFLCFLICFIRFITYFASFCNFIYHNYKIIHRYYVVKIEEEKTGIEIEEKYCKIAKDRIERENQQLKLWNS